MTEPRWTRWTALLACALALAGVSGRAAAQCTSRAQARAFEQSLAAAVGCTLDRLAGLSPACDGPPPPACAAALQEDVLALAFGPHAGAPETGIDPGLDEALACQGAIGLAAVEVAGSRLRLAARGSVQTDAALARAVEPVGPACTLDVETSTGLVLPAVGPQCAAAIPAPGAPVDAPVLRDCLATLWAGWVDRTAGAPPPRPNVVVILSDDQRFDTLGSEHAPPGAGPWMPTVLAELADSGLRFEQALLNHPACDPSRASLLSGQYSHRSGVPKNGVFGPFDESETLATWLADAGYRTALVGKYLNPYSAAPGGSPLVPPGWHRWFAALTGAYFGYKVADDGATVRYGVDEADYSTDVLRDEAVRFIETADPDAPFFLLVATIAPHLPAEPAPRHLGLAAGTAPWRPASWEEPDVSDKPPHIAAIPLHSSGWQASLDASRVRQLESLAAVDEAVGAVMDALRAREIADRTLVVFASDNGLFWGEHRLTGKKQPYEESIRTPLLVRYPPLVPLPRSDAHLVLNVDLTATIIDLAGATPGRALDGRSLVRVLDGTARDWRTAALVEGEAGGIWSASVREARWKYTEYSYGARELYDLQADPLELDNLASASAQSARIAEMGQTLRTLRPGWIDADGDHAPDDVDNCPGLANPLQDDADDDGIGDGCDVACADGVDNDRDGRIDHPLDPGCQGADDPSESPSRSRCGLGAALALGLVPLAALRTARRAAAISGRSAGRRRGGSFRR